MGTQGPNAPSAAVNSGAGTSWTNPANVFASDGVFTTAILAAAALSKLLQITGFGFSIPAGATITGILVEVQRAASAASEITDLNVILLKAGVAAGTDKADTVTFWPTTEAFKSYGSSTDLWGATWTVSDINASNFGVEIASQDTNLGATAKLDFVRITISYTSNISDGITGAVTTAAVESSVLVAVGSESNNVIAGATESAKLAAVGAITGGVTLTDLESGVKASTTTSANVATGTIEAANIVTSGSESAAVVLGVSELGGIASQQTLIPDTVTLAAYQTTQLVHAPLPCSDITEYLNLITSEHNQRPKFMAMVALIAQAYRDMQCLLKKFTTLFDIAQAQGDQLDILGLWIGVKRSLSIPLQNTVFFSWNTTGLGWGQGKWFGAGDTLTGYVTLSDSQYRTLLMARIASNMWDGTVPGAYNIWNLVLALQNFQLLIQDNQDMSISIIFLSNTVDAITQSLLVNGYLTFRPAGVNIAGYFKATLPVFGWGVQNNVISGWGTGSWLQTTQIG